MKKMYQLLVLATGLLVIGAGCSLTTTVPTKNANANTAPVNAVSTPSFTYQGQAGKSALALLQASHQVDATPQGYINAIDTIAPGDHQFWAFYVNGKQADVGAKDLMTVAHDTIVWKLESY